MNIVVQFIDSKNGNRSEPMAGPRHEMADKFRVGLTDQQKIDFGVIVLLEEEGDNWKYSRAPFMSATTFIEHFAPQLEVSQNG